MKINSFSKTYDKRKVLDFPGYDFEQGKIYAILGANGSGKSTLAKIISAVEKADGDVPCRESNCSLGYMPQHSYAFRMDVLHNVMITGADEAVAQNALEKIGIEGLADKKGHKLSGGETARMALARILVKHYDVLVLDEPCAAMDIKSISLAEDMIKEYCEDERSTIIMVTHSLQQARRLADEVLFFYEGQLVEQGDAKKLLNQPQSKELQEFLNFYG